MIFLFIHGGPGLNSGPEKNILQDSFIQNGHEIYFWNEPSSKRGHPSEYISYEETCRSLKAEISTLARKGKITVIAHSFGAFILNDILSHIENDLDHIILTAPVSNLYSLDMNIIREGIAVANDQSEKSFLEAYLKSTTESELYDNQRFHALKLATKDNQLLTLYWNKKNLISDYYKHFSEEQFQFNLDSFNSIRSTCSKNTINQRTSVPTSIIFGAHDPYISTKDISLLRSFFLNSKVHLLEESSHYGHIEETIEFLNICLEPKNKNYDFNSSHYL